jgi:hypothetical protein
VPQSENNIFFFDNQDSIQQSPYQDFAQVNTICNLSRLSSVMASFDLSNGSSGQGLPLGSSGSEHVGPIVDDVTTCGGGEGGVSSLVRGGGSAGTSALRAAMATILITCITIVIIAAIVVIAGDISSSTSLSKKDALTGTAL